MITALYVIGSTFGLLLLSARLREARAELGRMREQYDDRAQTVRDEYAAYAYGMTMSLACLLAALAAASWYAPPRPSARPADHGRTGARAGKGSAG